MPKGRPNGNPGNKGGGRKSAYQEIQDAEWHEKVWNDSQDVDALERLILSKNYSGRDMAALRLLKGDKYLIGKFMDKLVPDLHELSGPGGQPLFLPAEVFNKHNLNGTIESTRDAEAGSGGSS